MIYNVLEFGAVADGETLCTDAVQKAIEKCSADGGGIVRFEGGRYALSTVFLRSNVTVEITKNATVLGSLNFDDYRPDEKVDYPLYQDASHSFFHCSMFVAEGCENIKITGKGKVDMRSVWDEKDVRIMSHRGAKCIALKNCKNVEISNLEIYNATDLAVYFAGCENVDVFGIKCACILMASHLIILKTCVFMIATWKQETTPLFSNRLIRSTVWIFVKIFAYGTVD